MGYELQGYGLAGKLGEGGMATVYKAEQLSLQRPVAIKILHHSLIADDAIRERFSQESLIIARLSHPNIIPVIDQGVDSNNHPYFVMEYVKGLALDKAIKAANLTYSRLIDIAIQVCKGLAYAHKNGVVHRDIKPANVMVDYEGNVRVLDFGIAKLQGNEFLDYADDQQVLGTLAYMAPEQMEAAANADTRSDIYSLGVMLYQLFTGVVPKGKFTPATELNPEVEPTLANLIADCMKLNPEQRPVSIEAIKQTLLLLSKGRHISEEQKQRATDGVGKKFVLQDVLREDDYGGLYIFAEQGSKQLYAIKKKPRRSGGFEICLRLKDLNHPHLCRIHGASKNDSSYIVVQDYQTEGSLADRLAKAMDITQFASLAAQICSGLSFAHQKGIVHGNIRPSNILLDSQGRIKLVDFGLDPHYQPPSEAINWYNLDREEISTASDIYALGILFYHMLTAQPPVRQNLKLCPNQAFKKLPDSLQQLLRRMLAIEVKKRPASVAEVAETLEALFVEEATLVKSNNKPLPKNVDNPGAVERKPGFGVWLLLFLLLLLLSSQGYLLMTGQLQESLRNLLQ